MNRVDVVRNVVFGRGRYQIEAVLGSKALPLLEFTFEADEEAQARRLPMIRPHAELGDELRSPVANALIRAGARHPGIRDEDLARLHAEAREHGHLELFVDINALTQGLVAHLAKSLEHRLARIVTSSSSIDVLHEYQSAARRHHDGSSSVIAAWELARGMRFLRELRVPVHVHQLAPGAARYFRRGRADGPSDAKKAESLEHREEPTYIAEDRQMVAAFWDYSTTGSPRIPLFLVTADLALAHVCAAERVPFVFARAPREWSQALTPDTLWFDAYALAFRTCFAHAVLWELCVVLGTINVQPVGEPIGRASFCLVYDPRKHLPGIDEDVYLGEVVAPVTPPVAPTVRSRITRDGAISDRTLKLSLASIVDVLPTHPDQRLPASLFKLRDEDSLRQLWQIGEATGLFVRQGGEVVAGPNLADLLAALIASDYIQVNRFLRHVPGYDRVVREAEKDGIFPSSKKGGAATGWAVVLGAAYKLPGTTRFGLREVTDEQFERAVVRAHTEFAKGGRAVPLSLVVDRVCSEMGLSPIRFEALLNRCLGQRGLREFEAQRAKSAAALPSHQVLVSPVTSSPSSYLRKIAPGEGIVVGGKLVGSLVRRTGGS